MENPLKTMEQQTSKETKSIYDLKAGYCQDASPQGRHIAHKVRHIAHKVSRKQQKVNSEALQYWLDETLSRADETRNLYQRNFSKFSTWLSKTPDELLKQRQENLKSADIKTQRTIESYLIKFIAEQKKEGFSPATLQVMFASVCSFFEIHYVPLRMRRGDYPKGESIGVRRANKEAILKAVENKRTRNKKQLKAIILFLKDSGLRVSDAIRMNYEDIQILLERGDKVIPITLITKKSKIVAKTFWTLPKESSARVNPTEGDSL